MGNRLQNSESEHEIRIIACGAIAAEILAIKEQAGLAKISLECLPAILHNSPDQIPQAVDDAITAAKAEGLDQIFVGYADCGTGGMLDKVCEKHGVSRLDGPHCYSFFSGNEAFSTITEEEFTSFYLTDFLARQFEAFVIKPLGLDRHPELRDSYFGHYEKLVYLAQVEDAELDKKAKAAADILNLEYEKRLTGFGDLSVELEELHNAAT